MRIVLYILLFTLICTTTYGQQNPVISQYMYHSLAINPAYAGFEAQLSATATHRDQWVNFPGAPETQTFSIHSGFRQSKVGLGLLMIRDQVGIHTNFGLYGSYAYKIKFPIGTISMGLQGGFNSRRSDFSKLTLRDAGDLQLTGTRTKLNPNFGAGVYFNKRNFFAGISVPYILSNDFIDSEGVISIIKEKRNYYLQSGTTFQPTRSLKVKPSFLLHVQEGAPISFHLSSNFVIDDKVSLGASYRSGDSFILLYQMRLNENFHVGYSYDMTISDIEGFSRGTHEVMLNYRIKLPGIHKGIECPSYF